LYVSLKCRTYFGLPLKEEIENLRSHLFHKIKKVEDFQSYEIIKSVREYKGEEDKYVGENQLKDLWGNMPETVNGFILPCQY